MTVGRSDALKPVVLVPACQRVLGEHVHHIAGRKYVDAVRLAGALPLVVPPVDVADIDALLDLADGIFLTGSPSNVHPSHFGEAVHDATLPLDPERDAWTLPLIPRALERGIPLFAVCRGLQEVNVALGGSLHQAVHEQPGRHDHREGAGDRSKPLDVRYGAAHAIEIAGGGVLAQILGQPSIQVNSLHGQGVNRLAHGLRIEALSLDGQVEAFTAPEALGFNLCVQWHPEWRAAENADSLRLLEAFGAACAAYRQQRLARFPTEKSHG